MSRRPKYPKTDTNHTIVSEVLAGLGFQYGGCEFHLIDTSKDGGNLTDYLLICDGRVHFVEVKVPGEEESLTKGEAETQSWGVPFFIVTNREEVMDMLFRIATGSVVYTKYEQHIVEFER